MLFLPAPGSGICASFGNGDRYDGGIAWLGYSSKSVQIKMLLCVAFNVQTNHKMLLLKLLCGNLPQVSYFYNWDKNRSKLPKNTAA